MGVRRSDYILIGFDVGYDNYNEDNYEEIEDLLSNRKRGEITYLLDGYDGKYFIVGEVIYCDKDGYEGIRKTEFSNIENEFLEERNRVKDYIKDKFDIDCEPKLIILTHWT